MSMPAMRPEPSYYPRITLVDFPHTIQIPELIFHMDVGFIWVGKPSHKKKAVKRKQLEKTVATQSCILRWTTSPRRQPVSPL